MVFLVVGRFRGAKSEMSGAWGAGCSETLLFSGADCINETYVS